MRRKSERNKSKSSAEKKTTVEPSPRKSRRTSRRRKRSTSHSSSDDSDDVPLKTTVAVVEKQASEVSAPPVEPKKIASHSNSDEDKQEQPIWKVKTTEAPSGEIQKLKICLQRPPTTPERTEKSPRRRRGKASSQSDDASLTPDEKGPVSAGRRRLRRGSPAVTAPDVGTPSALAVAVAVGAAVTADLDAIVKDECMIVITETNEVRFGKGKFECSQTDGQTKGSRTVLPSGDESLNQCEIKQDDSIARTRVDEQQQQVQQQQQQQPTVAESNDTVKHDDDDDVTSVASTQKQSTKEPVAAEENTDSNRVVKDTSSSSSTAASTQHTSKVTAVDEKNVDSSQQSTQAGSLSVSETDTQQTSEAAAQQTSEAAVKASSEAVVQETTEVCSQESAISLSASEPTSQQTSEAAVRETSEAAVTATTEVCSQDSAISLHASEPASQETSEAVSTETSEATQQIKEAAAQDTTEAASPQTNEVASEETSEAASQETNEAASQETSEAASQETTSEAASQETSEAASQETSEATSLETSEAASQQTNETSVPESSEATAQDTNEAVSEQTNNVTASATSDTPVSGEVTSHDSDVVCTQSTEVTNETKDSKDAASPDTTEANAPDGNNEVTSSEVKERTETVQTAVDETNEVQTTEDTSEVAPREQCKIAPKETSEAECMEVDCKSEFDSESKIHPKSEQSEEKLTIRDSTTEQKGVAVKMSEEKSEQHVSESVQIKPNSVTEVLKDKSSDLRNASSPRPEKINEDVKSVDSSKQSSPPATETSTGKESSSSETISVPSTNITEGARDLSSNTVPTNRKRKWGKYEAPLVPDEHITMETITQLYPSMKILTEDELRMDTEVAVKEKPARKEREVTVQAPAPPVAPLAAAVKDDDVEKEISNIGLNRKISIVNDEASKLQPPPSPSKNAVSAVLYITNLVRPFTLKQLKELLSRTGSILDDGFWTDRIKSKCYVQYENEDEAEATRNALHGVQWPIGNGKKLMIDFGTREAMEAARNATTEAPTPAAVAKPALEKVTDKVQPADTAKKEPQVEESRWEKTKGAAPVREWDVGKVPQDQRDRSRSRERPTSRNDRTDKRRHSRNESPPNGDHVTARKKKKDEQTEVKLMDDLFHKTKATPSIYWLPLTPEQIAKKQQQRLQRMAEHKRRMEESRRGERDFGRGAPRTRRRSARHDGD